MIHDGYIDAAPSAQNAVDIFKDLWVGALPAHLAVKAGPLDLSDDARIRWLLSRVDVAGSEVLEFGPMEASHTAMLHAAGAKSVTAIEASKLAFMKCLIVKELLDLPRAHFLHGDFRPWLADDTRRWDVVVASGVLYHLADPVWFLERVAERTDTLFLWTHFIDDEAMPTSDPRRRPILRTRVVTWRGHRLTLAERSYREAARQKTFCGGVHSDHVWLHRDSLICVLQQLGYSSIETAFDDPEHVNGPSACFLARR
jgi:hypothetical protein